MRLADRASLPKIVIALSVIGCVAGGIYALHLGQDVNYDQMAYHYDSAYEFLRGRMTVDAAPQGLVHAYFNPLPYVPFYVMERYLPPWATVFLLGAWHGCNLGLVLVIATLVTREFTAPLRVVLCCGALLISLASPMALSEVGSTMSDITTSQLLLSGLALMLADSPPRRDRSGVLLTGLGSGLIGIAIGLKLSNMLFAPGVAACCAIGWRGWMARFRSLLLAGVAGALGVLLAGGFWAYRLWAMFRSPVFPYYDAIFESPEIDKQSWLHGTSFFDARFMPRTLLDAIYLPFRWWRNNATTAEIGFRDVRFAILICVLFAALIVAAVAATRLVALRRPVSRLYPAQSKLLVFFAVGFVFWIVQFSIQRYLLCLELLLGPVLVVMLGRLLRGRLLAVATVGLALFAAMTVQPPNWGHIKPRADWYGVQLPLAMQQSALVFLQGPISFVTPFLPATSRVVGLGGGPILRAGSGIFSDRIVTAALSATPMPPVFVMSDEPMSSDTRQTLDGYGLQLTGPCWPVPNRANHISACQLTRMETPGPSAANLHPGKPVAFDATLQGLPYLLPGWRMDTSSGELGDDLRLVFRLDPAFGNNPVRLAFQIAGLQAMRPGTALTLLANGKTAAVWKAPQLSHDAAYVGCIPAAALDAQKLVTLQFRTANQPTGIAISLRSLVADPTASCAAETTLD